MHEGQRSGICHFSSAWSEFGIRMEGSEHQLYYHDHRGEDQVLQTDLDQLKDKWVYLRSTWDLSGISHYSWSLNGEEWHKTGTTYRLEWGNYRGDRLGLYTYGNHGEVGEATFTDFRYVSADNATAVHPH